MDPVATFSLPSLPYAYDALEPCISKQIMELHHKKHHQTYVNNLNAALANLAEATKANDIAARIALQPAIKFNGGGHINHSLFWLNLAPPNSAPISSAPEVSKAIQQQWGSQEAFEEDFTKFALGIQGSGWVWLVKDTRTGRLGIATTKDQDPVGTTEVPIFGVDMWEHAFYLLYLNNKAEYVKNIWRVINWRTAEARFKGSRGDAFSALKGSI